MGRAARPWYRKPRGWYAFIGGRQVRLGVTDPGDRDGAEAAFRRALVAGGRSPVAGLPVDPTAAALVLARELAALLPKLPGLPNAERRQTVLGYLITDLVAIGGELSGAELSETAPVQV